MVERESYRGYAALPILACVLIEITYNLAMDAVWIRLRMHLAGISKLVYLAVGLLVIGWLFNTPPGLLGKADALGYAVCHRIDLRSFHLGERTLPLCARCTGMYLGAMLGLGYQILVSGRRGGPLPRWLWGLVALLAAGFAFDGLNSYLTLFPGAPTLYIPNNTLRLLTGSGMGLAIIIVLYPGFNQTVWRNWSGEPALANLRQVGSLIGLTIALDAIVLSGNPLVLYPLALLSAAGVLVLLSMVYAMLWLLIAQRENFALHLHQLGLPLAGGLGLAIIQIAIIDLGRFWLTGTWDGFHLG